MNRSLRYLVRVRGDRDRQLKISGVILTIICLALYINLTIMLSKRSSNRIQNPIKNETNETKNYVSSKTSTDLLYIVTSKRSVTSSVQPILSTTVVNKTAKYYNYSLEKPIKFENFGRPLNNSLYFNLQLYSLNDGYVNTVDLRLFSEWKGNVSLYLFIISSNTRGYEISYRYAINPQRNTTEWQTIIIPSRALSVSVGDLLAIGMQESSSSNHTNQIYGVQEAHGISAININKNTTTFTTTPDSNTTVAFGYTVIYNV